MKILSLFILKKKPQLKYSSTVSQTSKHFIMLLLLMVCSLSTISAQTWNGNSSTFWDDAANWTGGFPSNTADVLIPAGRPNYPLSVMNVNAYDMRSLHVEAGATMTIPNLLTININGSPGNAQLTSFLLEGTATNNGQLRISSTSLLIDGLTIETNGSFSNFSNFEIGSTGNNKRGIVINQGTFNNDTNGNITIFNADQGVGIDIAIGSIFNNINNAAIFISDTQSSGVWNKGTFNNTSNATMTIGDAGMDILGHALLNDGTFNNGTNALIEINDASQNGIYNTGTFINGLANTIGRIEIDGTSLNGIHNISGGGFTNMGTNSFVRIGQSEAVTLFGVINDVNSTFSNQAELNIDNAQNGILNYAIFQNTLDGDINIDNITQNGINNSAAGQFTNSGANAKITIGQTSNSIIKGIFNNNGGSFTNSTSSYIYVVNAFVGIENSNTASVFNNSDNAFVLLGQDMSGTAGVIGNVAIFNNNLSTLNNDGARIYASNTLNDGVLNNATINNLNSGAKIIIRNTGTNSINHTNGTITNNDCALIDVDDRLVNQSTFDNNAIFKTNFGSLNTIGTIKFDNGGGIIIDVNNSFNSNLLTHTVNSNYVAPEGIIATQTDAIHSINPTAVTINPVLLGTVSGSAYLPSTNWFNNVNMTNPINGTFNDANNILTYVDPMHPTPSTNQVLYFDILHNGSSCGVQGLTNVQILAFPVLEGGVVQLDINGIPVQNGGTIDTTIINASTPYTMQNCSGQSAGLTHVNNLSTGGVTVDENGSLLYTQISVTNHNLPFSATNPTIINVPYVGLSFPNNLPPMINTTDTTQTITFEAIPYFDTDNSMTLSNLDNTGLPVVFTVLVAPTPTLMANILDTDICSGDNAEINISTLINEDITFDVVIREQTGSTDLDDDNTLPITLSGTVNHITHPTGINLSTVILNNTGDFDLGVLDISIENIQVASNTNCTTLNMINFGSINVNPAPSFTVNNNDICSGASVALDVNLINTIPANSTVGFPLNLVWTSTIISGIVSGNSNSSLTINNATELANIEINDLLINTGTTQASVQYDLTLTSNNGCVSTQQALVNITPSPVVTLFSFGANSNAFCSGLSTTIDLSSIYSNVFITWDVDNVAEQFLGATDQTTPIALTPSNIADITQTLTNTTGSNINATYVITPYINGCSGPTATLNITVHPEPDGHVFPVGNLNLCVGQEDQIHALTNGLSYLWTVVSVDNGVTGTIQNGATTTTPIIANNTSMLQDPIVSFTAAPLDSQAVIELVVIDANTCTSIPEQITLTSVGPGVEANGPAVNTGVHPCENFINAGIASVDLTSYVISTSAGQVTSWYLGDPNTTGVLINNPNNFLLNNTHDLWARVTNGANNCFVDIDLTESVLPLPQVVSPPSNASVCVGENAQFSVTGPNAGETYQWAVSTDGGNNYIDIDGNINATAITSNLMLLNVAITDTNNRYRCILTSTNGCTNTSFHGILTVNALPTANAGMDASICPGISTNLNASGGTLYSWSPTTGLSNPLIANPVATPISTTTYTVAVTDGNSCVSSDDVIITVLPAAVANAGADVAICVGETTTLNATGGNTYTWTPAASLSDNNIANPVAAPVATETYTVSVIDGNNCVDTDDVIVTVNTLPVINVQPQNTTVCANTSATFSVVPAITAGTTYQWQRSTNNGVSFSPINNATNSIYNTTNTSNGWQYNVIVTSLMGCSTTSQVATVTVNPTPIGIITANATSICNGESINLTFTATSGTGNYDIIVDGDTYTNISSGDMFATLIEGVDFTGNYTLNLTSIIDNGVTPNCPNTGTLSSISIMVDQLPTLTNLTPTVCAYDLINLADYEGTNNGQIGASGGTWTTSGGAAVPTTNIGTVITGETYNYTYMSTCMSANVMATITFTVNQPPIITTDPASLTVCQGDTAHFSFAPVLSGQTYQWYVDVMTGNGFQGIMGATNATYNTVNYANGWQYRVEVTSSGCTSTSNPVNQATITVNNLPIVDAGTDQTICPSTTANLSASGASTYVWTPAATLTNANSATPTAIPTTNTTYMVEGTDGNGCKNTDDVNINLFNVNAPVINIVETSGLNNNDGIICNGKSATLTASGGVSYSWNTIPAQNTASITVSPTATTTYTVTMTDSNGCITTNSATITVNPLSTFALYPSSTAACVGSSVTFTGEASIPTDISFYTWQVKIPGGTFIDIANANTPNLTLTNVTASLNNNIYRLVITNLNGCDSNSGTATLTINSLPTIDITTVETSGVVNNDGIICSADMVTLAANGGVSYLWNNGSTMSTLVVNPTTTTTYSVTGTDANGCESTQSVQIIVNTPQIPTISSMDASGIPNDNTICLGGDITLIAAGSQNYLWSNGNMTSMTTLTPSNINDTLFSVIATDLNNCVAYDTIDIDINPLPQGAFSLDQSIICAGETVELIFDGTTTQGNLLTLNGTTYTVIDSLTPFLTLTPSTSMTFMSTQVTDTHLCTNTLNQTATLTVNDLPTVTDPQIMVCNTIANYTVNLAFLQTYNNAINTQANTSITWYLGQPSDNGVIITASDTIDLSQNLTNVWVEIEHNITHCKSELRATVTINALPNAMILATETSSLFDDDATICLGDAVTLTASGGVSFLWDDTGNSTTASINVSPIVNTTYTVQVTNNNGCVQSTSIDVIVNPLPNGNILLAPTTICAGDSVYATFSGTNTAPYTITVTEDGTPTTFVSAGTNDTFSIYTPSMNAQYSLMSITDGFACNATPPVQMQNVTVNPLPTFNPGFEIRACTNFASDFDLTATTPGTGTATWFNNDVLIANPDHVNLNNINNGDLSVTLTDGNTCDSTLIVPLTINPLPILSNQTFTICMEAATGHNLTSHEPTATTGGVWRDANGIVITTPTNYNISNGDVFDYAYSDINTCTGHATYTFVFAPVPNGVIIPVPSTVCAGEPVSLIFDATSGFGPFDITVNGVNYTMINNLDTFATNQVPTIGNETYTITNITDGLNGCTNTSINNTATVTINPLPTVNNIGNIGALPAGFNLSDITLLSTPVDTNTVFTWTIDELGSAPTGATAGTTTGANPVIPGFMVLDNNTAGLNVTEVTVTAELNGCVGPAMVFTISVEAAPYITNTDPQLTDPCTCESDGWFSEQVAVISGIGETWKVVETTLYDAIDGNVIAPTTPLTLVPMSNNDTTYVLNGFHHSDFGYTIIVESPNYPGFRDTLTSRCFYPDADFALSDQYCDVSQAIDLSSTIYGDTLDNIEGVDTFYIDGNIATSFDPQTLGVGNYTVTMQYDAKHAAMNDSSDPGCIVEVTKNVEVVEIPADFTLNCHGINISLDDNCQGIVHPDMLLSGNTNFPCFDVFNVTLIDENGVNLGDEVGFDQIGQQLMAILTYIPTGNTCMTTVFVEDKMAPIVLYCPTDTVFCYEDLTNLVLSEPIFEDNCSTLTPIYTDGPVYNFNCSTPQGQEFSGYFTRHWIAEDDAGYTALCNQNVYLARPTVNDVDFPLDWNGLAGQNPILDCSIENTSDSITGIPTFNGNAIDLACMFSYISQDILTIPLGCNGIKISREWIVMDNCRGTMIRDTQTIIVMDVLAPTFNTPSDVIISSDWNSCDVAQYGLPVITLNDNCSQTNTLTYFVTDPNVTIVNNNIALNLSDTTTIYFSAEDECNNMAVDSFNVIVQDLVSPTMICNGQQVIALNNLGVATVDAIEFNDSSYDNCGNIVSYRVRRMADNCNNPDDLVFGPNVSFCCADIGQEVMVVLEATDEAGNTNICMVSAIVQDKIAPVFNFCPADTTITCEALDGFFSNPVDFGEATAVGSCAFAMISSNTGMSLINECRVGSVIRTWTAYNDANMNGIFDAGEYASTCSQTINVTYDSNYTVTFPADVNLSFCNFNGIIGNINDVIISQNSCGSINPEVAVAVNGPFVIIGAECQSKYEVTYTVRDNCIFVATDPHTNEGTAVPGQPLTFTDDGDGYFQYLQTITLTDPNAPTVPANNTTVDYVDDTCTPPFVDLSFAISDDCTQSIDESFVTYEKFVDGITTPFETGIGYGSDYFDVGEYIVNYSILDSCGNASLRTTTINVLDTIAPIMNCPSNSPPFVFNPDTITMNSELTFIIPLIDLMNMSGFSASDNCGTPQISLDGDIFVDTLFVTCDYFGDPITGQVTYNGMIPIYVSDGTNQDTCNINVAMNVNLLCGFTTPPSIQVSGAINTIDDVYVNEAMVMVTSEENSDMSYTDEGAYMVDGFEDECNLDITPHKNDGIREGINTYDLVLIGRHILETSIIENPYYLIAADVNNSGTITGADVVMLRQLILFNTDEIANNTSWRFVPESYVFPDGIDPLSINFPESINYQNVTENMENIDFVGIKIGDVDGTYTDGINEVNTRNRFNGFIDTRVRKSKEPSQYYVDFSLSQVEALEGLQLSLAIKNAKILDVIPTNATTMQKNNFRIENDELFMSWNNHHKIEKESLVFTLKVYSEKPISSKDISLTDKIKAEGYASSDVFYIMSLSSADSDVAGLSVSQNRPNPFTDKTLIDFNVVYKTDVTLSIFDIRGQLVLSKKMYRVSGQQQFEIKGENLTGSGIYYYQIETNNAIETRSLIFIER